MATQQDQPKTPCTNMQDSARPGWCTVCKLRCSHTHGGNATGQESTMQTWNPCHLKPAVEHSREAQRPCGTAGREKAHAETTPRARAGSKPTGVLSVRRSHTRESNALSENVTTDQSPKTRATSTALLLMAGWQDAHKKTTSASCDMHMRQTQAHTHTH